MSYFRKDLIRIDLNYCDSSSLLLSGQYQFAYLNNDNNSSNSNRLQTKIHYTQKKKRRELMKEITDVTYYVHVIYAFARHYTVQ